MRIKVTKFSFIKMLFFSVWVIYEFSYWVFQSSELRHIINGSAINLWIIRFSTLLLALIPILKQRIASKKMLIFIAAGMMFALIYFNLKLMTMLLFVMLLVAASYMDFDEVIRVDLITKIAIMLLVVCLCLVGVLPNFTDTINEKYKMALGFEHPNTLAFLGCAIIVEYVYVRYTVFRKTDVLFVAAALIFIYKTAASRTTLFTVAAVLLVMIILKISPKIFQLSLVRFLFVSATGFIASFSLICVYLYSKGNKFMIELNNIVTGRLNMGASFLRKYGVKLLGQDIVIIGSREAAITGTSPKILDNAYLRALVNYGLVFFLFLIIGYSVFFWFCVKKKNPQMAVLTLFFILIGFGETHTILITSNVTLLFLLSPYKVECTSAKKLLNATICQFQNKRRSYHGSKQH